MTRYADTTPAAASLPTDCDLIMKGGITSGVVYPAAVSELAERYRFRSIGGASAGAIAAAATAAAELGRDAGGFDRLAALSDQLTEEGFLLGLFQPTKPARFAFDLLTALQQRTGRARVATAAARLVRRNLGWVVAGALVAAALAVGFVAVFGGELRGAAPWAWAALAIPVVAGALLGLGIGAYRRARRLVTRHLPASGYGVCPGMPTPAGKGRPALVPWLHEQLQACAGKPLDEPVTFADLDAAGITLQMMTTDVTAARPARLPFPDSERYLFSVEELAALFPDEILAHLRAHSTVERAAAEVPRSDPDWHPELRRLPRDDLPILVGTRMSLSFPVLLSAVPLWTVADDRPLRHWISDGGIASNFPLHFFDAWLPGRPTFGLNLVPEWSEPSRRDPATGRPLRRRTPIASVGGLLSQVLDTMQNWQDTMQTELPGFRDRVEDIELDDDEGGMNLTMSPETVAGLIAKGHAAGTALAERDLAWWQRHRFERYHWFATLLEEGLRGRDPGELGGVARVYAESFDAALAAGRGDAFTPPHTRAWHRGAAAASRSLLAAVGRWGAAPSLGDRLCLAWHVLRDPAPATFRDGHRPEPELAMRITPDV